MTYGLAWADDVRTCFYVRPDDAMRPNEIWRHHLGTPASEDVRVFREDDERFFLGVGRTRSGRFVLIDAASKLTSETWFIPTAAPEQPPAVIAPREHEHEYTVEHHEHPDLGDRFLIVTNSEGARNFRLVAAPVADPGARTGSRSWPTVTTCASIRSMPFAITSRSANAPTGSTGFA